MTSKILQFNEKLDHVKRFLQTTERGHFDDEIINLQSEFQKTFCFSAWRLNVTIFEILKIDY